MLARERGLADRINPWRIVTSIDGKHMKLRPNFTDHYFAFKRDLKTYMSIFIYFRRKIRIFEPRLKAK